MEKKLTIGMAHYSDFHGVFFTVQDIIKELVFNGRVDLLRQIEFVIVENNNGCEHSKSVKDLANKHANLVRVIDLEGRQGTSCTRNRVIQEARGKFVLVMDCHVLLCPVVKTIERLIDFINYNDKSEDLYCGPLVFDSMNSLYTHFNDEWSGGMWGRWGISWSCVCEAYNFSVIEKDGKSQFVDLATQERLHKCKYCDRNFPELDFAGHESRLKMEGYERLATDPQSKPFEVFAQGLGLFLTRKNSWLGFNDNQSGFGGEECYIHEKYRLAGRKTNCLPFLKWVHRFGRPEGVQYAVSTEQKMVNYIHEFKELGLSPKPLIDHFVKELKVPQGVFAEHWGNNNIKVENPDTVSLEDQIKSLQDKLEKLNGKKCCKK